MTTNTNEFDDLKLAWQTLSRTLEGERSLTLPRPGEASQLRLRDTIGPLVTAQMLQLVCGVVVAVSAGKFWVSHWGAVHLVVYGMLLHAYGIMLIIGAARDLMLIRRIDYSAPVVAIQRQVAELRTWRLRAAAGFVVAGCLIWPPLLMILLYAAGADVWLTNRLFVYLNILSSFACVGIAYGLFWWSKRPGREKLTRSFRDSVIGRRVLQAQAELEEIERFEGE